MGTVPPLPPPQGYVQLFGDEDGGEEDDHHHHHPQTPGHCRHHGPPSIPSLHRLRGRLRNALSLINRRSNRAPEMSSCETCRIQLVSYSHVICRHIRLVSCDLSGTREQQVKWEAPHWRAPPKNCQRWKTYKVPGGEL